MTADRRPSRACVACRSRQPQEQLVRVTSVSSVITPDGPPGAFRRPGRGAYLCPNAMCVERALARESLLLRRALRIEGSCTVSEDLARVIAPQAGQVAGATDGASAS